MHYNYSLESPSGASISSPGVPPPPPVPPTTPQGGVAVSSSGVPVPPPPPPPAPPLPGQPSSSQMQLRRINWEKLQTDKLDGTIWRQVLYLSNVCVRVCVCA